MNPSDAAVQKIRAWTGLLAVIIGDLAIAVAATFGITVTSSNDAGRAQVVSIFSSAFTAIGTLTTAYFGIKAVSNTAQSSMAARDGVSDQPPLGARPRLPEPEPKTP
jgi:hypothetical protein